MTELAEDWFKPRTHGQRLTRDEIDFIRAAHARGDIARLVARQLRCTTRIIRKYFAQFEGRAPAIAKRRPIPSVEKPKPPQPKSVPTPNFYRSNFEPT